jgi:uncharacterized protein YndB with AHSA1/START domain
MQPSVADQLGLKESDMEAIRHRIGAETPIATVYDAIATRDGLASWWTRQVEGDSRVGSQLAFYFGGDQPGAVMDIVELSAPKRVVWHCADGPAEWLDTTVTFDLSEQDGETILLFTHAGWREAVPFMSHCSMRWAYFLMGLKAGVDGGNATPWPDDDKISRWA